MHRHRVIAGALGATVVLAMAMSGGAVTPAHARPAEPGDLVVSQSDPSGDVQVFAPTTKGPPNAARRSADILGFTITDEVGGARFDVVFKRIMPVRKNSQVIDIQLSPTGASGKTWFDDINMSPQNLSSSRATFSPSLDGQATLQVCDDLVADLDKLARSVSLDVPDRCLPQDATKIKVFASYGAYRIEGGAGYSLDRLKVKGAHLLHVID